ncbi:MAG: Transcriptional regulator, TrmB, partial [uncultured bacterium]
MQEVLKQFGFDEDESKIYLALLELGPSTVTEVTKKAGITRTLGYVVLEKLGLQGLVTRTKDGSKKMKYVAEHPRNFVQYVKNKKNSWERRIGKAESLLPDLLAVYKEKDKPVIRYQEGIKGITSLFEESLQSKTEILSVTDVESWQDPEFWQWAKSYNRERNK